MKFSDYALYIRPEVQGSPDFLIERAARDAAIDFCKKTDVYTTEPEIIAAGKNVNEFDVSLPAGTELNRILDVFIDKRELKPVSFSELQHRLGDETDRGIPAYYSQRDNKQFYVAPIPNAMTKMKVIYSLKPTQTAMSIPDTIGKEHLETIVHGALYRLQMMSAQPWARPDAAVANKGLFDKEVGRTVRQVKYGFSGGSLTCKPRAFI